MPYTISNKGGEVNITIICPVRELSPEWRDGLTAYTYMLEGSGHHVHLPFRDTNQDDKTGFDICSDHARHMVWADEVHIAYYGKSEGWLFDLGMAFVLSKPIVPITGYFPMQTTGGKSYTNMVWDWNSREFNF